MQIIVSNIATEYRDEGTGPVILFLHGWQDNLQTFDTLVPFLIPKWRVVRLDLPGFGRTEIPPQTWCLDNYVEFVSEFLRKLNLKVYAVVGHSMGGRIIIKGIASKKIAADKIVLIAAAGVANRNTLGKFMIKILAKIGGAITLIPPFIFWRNRMRTKLYERLGSDYFKAGKLKKTYLNLIRENLSSSASQITSPALLVWGEKDSATPLSEGLRLTKLISDSTLKVIPEAGHFVHQEQVYQVATYITEFLNDSSH